MRGCIVSTDSSKTRRFVRDYQQLTIIAAHRHLRRARNEARPAAEALFTGHPAGLLRFSGSA